MKNHHPLFCVLFAFALLSCTTKENKSAVQQEIDSGWQFRQVGKNDWLPATVPGVVHTDLMNHGVIDDPFFRLNERDVQWVDKEDWEYKTTLTASPALFEKENIELYFKGLDTYADVYLNDNLILSADNMFREWRVPVKTVLKKGENELRVYFHSPVKIDIPKYDWEESIE